jgi:hypothetical protein
MNKHTIYLKRRNTLYSFESPIHKENIYRFRGLVSTFRFHGKNFYCTMGSKRKLIVLSLNTSLERLKKKEASVQNYNGTWYIYIIYN